MSCIVKVFLILIWTTFKSFEKKLSQCRKNWFEFCDFFQILSKWSERAGFFWKIPNENLFLLQQNCFLKTLSKVFAKKIQRRLFHENCNKSQKYPGRNCLHHWKLYKELRECYEERRQIFKKRPFCGTKQTKEAERQSKSAKLSIKDTYWGIWNSMITVHLKKLYKQFWSTRVSKQQKKNHQFRQKKIHMARFLALREVFWFFIDQTTNERSLHCNLNRSDAKCLEDVQFDLDDTTITI